MPTTLPFPSSPPVTTIAEVVDRLGQLDAGFAPGDGVAAFNRLYLRMTASVQAAVAGGRFEDPAFMHRLDVGFAQRYLDAITADAHAPDRVPRAWQCLFDARHRRGITALRFAVAGMNAHINFDLALALVAACAEAGVAPLPGSPQHRDYLRINDVLAATSSHVKDWLLPLSIAIADEVLGDSDDLAALWSIVRARDAAWTQAETLWALRAVPALADRVTTSLDRFVGFAGRSLLAPQVLLPRRA